MKYLKNALIATIISAITFPVFSQIYSPEGLNMPGDWNTWVVPPTNNLAFASSTQVTDGRIILIDVGTMRWQTIFNVAATGGDVTEGTYNWLFTSGPTTDYFANKWADVTVTLNTLQEYNYQGSTDNNITLTNNHWYTMVWEDAGYANARAIFMETSLEPIEILTVSFPTSVLPDEAVVVSITTSANPSPEELIYLRYTTDSWTTSNLVDVNMIGSDGTATIIGQPEGTTVQYYAFSSTVSGITADYDLYTIKLNNNEGVNYEYTVNGSTEIDWANLQYPESGIILIGESFDIYSQVFIDGLTNQTGQAADVQAWIGYSLEDTDPSTWTNWISSAFSADVGNNDEYIADLGIVLSSEGTYYYASRFQYLEQDVVYGGFSTDGGGFWDGSTYVSGLLTVNGTPPDPQIGWANLQSPEAGTIEVGQEYLVYAQAWIENITGQPDPADGLQSWIGYSLTDTDPVTWTNWIQSDYFGASGSNDEFTTDLGAQITTPGTYYYASRFQYIDQDYVYGGYSADGGGFWDGSTYVSGVLTLTGTPPDPQIGWANLQYPEAGTIEVGQEYLVYAQAWIENITGQPDPAAGLQSWIGYSLTDTDPATWTNWIQSDYFEASESNDEYINDLGAQITTPGTYYYASRFQYIDQDYVYGGYSSDGGGFWDGSTYVSGVLTVTGTPPDPQIGWANLQYPEAGTIEVGQEYLVYSQAWIENITGQTTQAENLQAWIGFSSSNSDPATWTEWIQADYFGASGSNDEFIADLGAQLTLEGTYYYASRFQYIDQDFVYGGYSADGGGFWDGTTYVSGVLTIENELITYPVTFTVTDNTHLYSNIKFKGSMTNWEPVDMEQSGNIWTVTLDILPGSYEWGVFEDDGTPDGIWLIIWF